MEAFARDLNRLLDDPKPPKKPAAAPHARPLDDDAFEALEPALCLNLTGDNTAQPSVELAARLRAKAATS